MPQLRDSTTHAGAGSDGADTAHSPQFGTGARIFGIETEYGVAITGADRHVDARQVAATMFQPVVVRSRSTNTYLSNGARLYLDVGSHPEYATAETRDPLDALAQDLAGEWVIRRLADQAQRRIRVKAGRDSSIHVFKNNVDSAGHAFGCHENYLVRRYVPLAVIERELLPFLITRQLFSGAGRMTGHGFELSQRADYLDEAVSSATTRARPMVNTRDEPHADPREFRRLHVIIGDSNRSQFVTFMKLATTHLVLGAIEAGVHAGRPTGFGSCALADPNAANRAISRDITGTAGVRLAADRDGNDAAWHRQGTASALDIQRRYLDIVTRAVQDDRDAVAGSLPRTDVDRVLAQWRELLDLVAAGDVDALAERLDWAAKYRLFNAVRRHDPHADLWRIQQLDMDYHDIVNGSVYPSLVRRGMMRTLIGEHDIKDAVEHPPQDTRAALRGRFVQAALRHGAQFSCDWTRLTLTQPAHDEVVLLDPFDAASTPRFDALLARVEQADTP
ncbi:Pup--protein ligase [Bifidobacterium thermophilum]|uniref:Pup--protein ligase n=1 Tax=Bifidobacterium thermophilum TaxID=33905 RepID=UPI0030ABC3ED